MAVPLYCEKCGGNLVNSGSHFTGSIKFIVLKCQECGHKISVAENVQ
ncbi:MAG TPA: hypothetical protein VJB90_05600 [Candidatus Nanoarchaeia archaeon]|nr:hypothetical protein [Candidatus Nanoarchaeia archaeon]